MSRTPVAQFLLDQKKFAHTKGRGALDALAYLTISWLLALNRRMKVAVYCSDVSGAFDRVRAERLLEKLRSKGVPPTLVALGGSWLQQRTAQVVDGQRSAKMSLKNMVFQGTVLAILEGGLVEIVYADDLNGFKEFEHNASVDSIMAEAKKCQSELHNWGRANQVTFDPAKESMHIVSHAEPHGDSSKLLGVHFDCQLRMDPAVSEVVSQGSWKLTTMRARRFHEVPQLVRVYKSKVLSFVECRTPAVYHATKTTPAGTDAVRTRFLRERGLSDEDAFLHFNLAPLEARRDIAMLGLFHRSVLRNGPRPFRDMFLPASPH